MLCGSVKMLRFFNIFLANVSRVRRHNSRQNKSRTQSTSSSLPNLYSGAGGSVFAIIGTIIVDKVIIKVPIVITTIIITIVITITVVTTIIIPTTIIILTVIIIVTTSIVIIILTTILITILIITIIILTTIIVIIELLHRSRRFCEH